MPISISARSERKAAQHLQIVPLDALEKLAMCGQFLSLTG
jgi:hypothetical protein